MTSQWIISFYLSLLIACHESTPPPTWVGRIGTQLQLSFSHSLKSLAPSRYSFREEKGSHIQRLWITDNWITQFSELMSRIQSSFTLLIKTFLRKALYSVNIPVFGLWYPSEVQSFWDPVFVKCGWMYTYVGVFWQLCGCSVNMCTCMYCVSYCFVYVR
jgi:hypothetical protein